MGISLLTFAKRFKKRFSNLDKAANEVAKAYALDLVAELAIRTPADTSRALSNWRVGLGSPVSGEIAPHVPGEGASTKSQSVTIAITEAERKLKAKKPGQPAHVTNNVDYIDDLNRGSSTQAPSGFVEAAKIRVAKRNPKLNLKG